MGIAADAVVILHLAFILFVAAGGFLALRWPRLAWLHLPCVLWGIVVEATGWICPLTPLEVHLRLASGEPGYTGDFIDRYLLPIVYPPGLTRGMQIGLGIALLIVNVFIYARLLHRRRKDDDYGKGGR